MKHKELSCWQAVYLLEQGYKDVEYRVHTNHWFTYVESERDIDIRWKYRIPITPSTQRYIDMLPWSVLCRHGVNESKNCPECNKPTEDNGLNSK